MTLKSPAWEFGKMLRTVISTGNINLFLDMLTLMGLQHLGWEYPASSGTSDLRFGRHWPVTITEAMADRRGLRTDIDTSGAARKEESGSRWGRRYEEGTALNVDKLLENRTHLCWGLWEFLFLLGKMRAETQDHLTCWDISGLIHRAIFKGPSVALRWIAVPYLQVLISQV